MGLPKRLSIRVKPTEQMIALRGAVGEAIEQYSQVEYLLSVLLQKVLNIPQREASITFKAVQNVRSRGNMFGDLLALRFGRKLNPHWKKCNAFLLILAEFRNAIAHWTFSAIVYKKPGGGVFIVPGLHSIGDDDMRPITEGDIAKFVKDCNHIEAVLNEFINLISGPPVTSQEISQIQPVRPNLAFLQRDLIPRAQQLLRSPSRPSPLQKGKKPSAKQRRQRALSVVKKKP